MIGYSETLDFLHGAFSIDSSICGDTNITLLTGRGALLGVAKITFIVPKDDRGAPFL